MHSNNFIFWKKAFERKQVDIYTLAQMVNINGKITQDEFQEITGMNYIPDTTNNKLTFISTIDIMQELAANRISNMKKDMIINSLSKQIANNKLELIQLKNEESTVKEGN